MSQVASSAGSPTPRMHNPSPLHPAANPIPAGQTAPSVSQQTQHPLAPHPTVSSLTHLLASDTSRPSTTNVKVAHPLLRDLSNNRSWLYDLVNAAVAKECVEAFQSPMPCTRANAAAMILITSSVPEDWGTTVALQPTAFHALEWFTQ